MGLLHIYKILIAAFCFLQDCLRACWEQIEETLVKRLANAARPITASVTLPVGIATNHKLAEQQLDPNDPLLQAETPTDVQDILF